MSSSSTHLIRRVGIVFIICALTLPIGFAALASGTGVLRLPYPLFVLLQRQPMMFPAHMIAAGLSLMIIPLVILLRRHPTWHRRLGRVAVACVLIGGITSLPVALVSEANAMARAGFAAQGVTWIALLAGGVLAIAARNFQRHMRFMLAMAAVASGAIWLRLATMAAVELMWPFEPTYATAAWLCWLLPLLIVIRWTRGLATGAGPVHLARRAELPSLPWNDARSVALSERRMCDAS
jgi:hypothetical protein